MQESKEKVKIFKKEPIIWQRVKLEIKSVNSKISERRSKIKKEQCFCGTVLETEIFYKKK